jgi:hypothetical protein
MDDSSALPPAAAPHADGAARVATAEIALLASVFVIAACGLLY